ncbi:MAG: molybdopterin synthase small subunit [Verrucomicrobia bacterium]|nr:molybdopterin synthase small subunit [Verrucomicrobiota bacterium]
MGEPRKIQVRFFAVLREQAGVSALDWETEARTATDLYGELKAKRGLTFPAGLLRVSINERYATMDTPLQAGDRVVFIPPVAGG